MNVNGEKELKVFRSSFHTPDSSPVLEVSFIVSVFHRGHDFKGDGHASVIGDVLTDDEFARDFASVDLDAFELVDHAFGKLFEFLVVFIGPPIGEVAILIAAGAIVIEGVADLVSDDGTDATKVLFSFLLEAIERSLEDSGREGDVVRAWVIASVDKMSWHSPFASVDWLIEFL